MELPIDYVKRPFKLKYIDEETELLSRWMIFGGTISGLPLGQVDVSDYLGNDVFCNVPLGVATQIVDERNAWVDSLVTILNEDTK